MVDTIGLAVTNSKKMGLCLRRESKSSRDVNRLFVQVHCSHLHCFHQLDVCRGPALAVEQRRHVVVLHLELLHLPDRKGWHGNEMKTKDNKLFDGVKELENGLLTIDSLRHINKVVPHYLSALVHLLTNRSKHAFISNFTRTIFVRTRFTFCICHKYRVIQQDCKL